MPPALPAASCSNPSCHLGNKLQDVIWLLTLGAAWNGPVRGEGLMRELAALSPSCSSCRQVLSDCIEEMLRTDCLEGTPCLGLTLTAYGRMIFIRLMNEPAAPATREAGWMAARLRLRYLPLLEHSTGELRQSALQALLQATGKSGSKSGGDFPSPTLS